MSDKYWLDGHEPVLCEDLMQWAEWFGAADRVVARDNSDKGDVSTVFLGLDHRFMGDGPPILFETMVFDGPLAGETDRCSTWGEAEKGHERMVARVRELPEEQP